MWRVSRPSIVAPLPLILMLAWHPSFAADALGEAQTAVQEWVRVEQLISQERRQWREEQSAIEGILTILQAERRELGEQISQAQEVTSRADEERASLVAQIGQFEANSAALASRVADYERQLTLISRYLPTPLRSELAPQFARIEALQGGGDAGLSQRAQTVFALMAAITNFDSRMTLSTEVLEGVYAQAIEVRVLYFGLSRAFYANADLTRAGIGIPAETGWQWTSEDDMAVSIGRAIEIHETRVTPQLLDLLMESSP